MLQTDNLGQYFTQNAYLQSIVFSLCRNKTKCLEPSAGAGHLVSFFEKNGVENITSIEIDNSIENIAKTIPTYVDFFEYVPTTKFDTIFGNPPFVKYKNIATATLSKISNSLLSSCNLFYYFIEKAFHLLSDNGELVFIVPREFFNSTRATGLRNLLFDNGTITDVYDFGDAIFFKNASPNIIIFRYEKDNFSHNTNFYNFKKRKEVLGKGTLLYLSAPPKEGYNIIGDIFDVKVGLVSGENNIYEGYKAPSKFHIDIICSDYYKTRVKRRVLFLDGLNNIEELLPTEPDLYAYMVSNKQTLINRGIKKFSDTDWYKFGAVRNIDIMTTPSYCIYVNAKTRENKPFFIEKSSYFDGSILCLSPKKEVDVEEWCNRLNNSQNAFIDQGLLVEGRYLFTVRNLSNFILD